jgi:hypothetical protein
MNDVKGLADGTICLACKEFFLTPRERASMKRKIELFSPAEIDDKWPGFG